MSAEAVREIRGKRAEIGDDDAWRVLMTLAVLSDDEGVAVASEEQITRTLNTLAEAGFFDEQWEREP